MRLRRVVISGFKTFARRSEVCLEPGITAIVGPNGSGKSNLVDAIRWALGETNARELRGARMDEVIYSGGDGRGRMGFAEVELIFDNEDGRLPVDDVEVSVSRRVVRHGDSEFRLNGDRVRLRDLERVLGTTGLTQSGYAVVAQHDIDAIIEATPAQRRALVEQAAGVRSLRAGCEDALGRVGSAEVTLRRFEDLLAETEPRLAELAAHAALAIDQRELTEQLTRLRGSLAREAWRSARAQLRQARRRLDAASSRLEAARTAEQAFAGSLAGHRAHLEAQRSLQAVAARQLEEARVHAERARGDQQRSVDRVHSGVVQRGQAAEDAREAGADLALRAEAVDALATAARDALALRARHEQRVGAAREARAAAAAELARSEQVAARAEAARVLAEREHAEADAAVRRCAIQLRLFSDVAQVLDERVAQGRARAADLRQRAADAAAARVEVAVVVLGAEAAHRAAATTLEGARADAVEATARLDAAREVARAALARAATLRGQVEGALGGRGAIAEAVSGGDLVARRLIDSFSVVDPADAAAVEAALEQHLGAWIVDDLDAAAALLVVGGSGREELLRRDATPSEGGTPALPGDVRPAIEAIRAAAGAEGALAACLAGAWLAPDVTVARGAVALAGGRAVLPDGTVLTAHGLRGGGRPGRTLELAAAEHEAAEHAARAIDSEQAADAVRRSAQEAVANAEAAERASGEAVQAARLDAAETAARATAAAEAVAGEEGRLGAVEAELANRQDERGSLEQEDSTATAGLAAAEATLQAARARAVSAREVLAVARRAAEEAGQRLEALESEAAANALVADDHRRRVAAAGEAVTDAGARLSAASARLLGAELTVLAGLARRRAAGHALVTADAAVEAALRGIDRAAPDLAVSERAVDVLEAERSEVAVVLARAQDEATAARADVETSEARVAEMADAVRDDDRDEGPEPEAGDAERAEREIVRLERRIAALGPVNALAPEQHDHLAVRVGLLRAGRDDLGTACADIRVMATRLTAEIDRRFEAVFGAVSVHFHELFAELFPGGRATLRREEVAGADDEPGGADRDARRRAGVEILAQPPGKRLQPLSLFSGGERALTALAVILALQQVNPSPFYVFDEVDASLDDSNVLRFSRLLTRLAGTQQFIIVTHNHVTMAAADALHGVTSDSDGVSSVISVRFDAGAGEKLPEGNVVGLRQSTMRAAV